MPLPREDQGASFGPSSRPALADLVKAYNRLYRFAKYVTDNACDMPGEPDYVIVNRFQMDGLRQVLEAENLPRDGDGR